MKKTSMQIVLGITLGAGIGTAMGVAAVAIGSNFRGNTCAECAEVHEEHRAES